MKYRDYITVVLPGTEIIRVDDEEEVYDYGSKDLIIRFAKDKRLLNSRDVVGRSARVFVEWLTDNVPKVVFDRILEEIDIYREKRSKCDL